MVFVGTVLWHPPVVDGTPGPSWQRTPAWFVRCRGSAAAIVYCGFIHNNAVVQFFAHLHRSLHAIRSKTRLPATKLLASRTAPPAKKSAAISHKVRPENVNL